MHLHLDDQTALQMKKGHFLDARKRGRHHRISDVVDMKAPLANDVVDLEVVGWHACQVERIEHSLNGCLASFGNPEDHFDPVRARGCDSRLSYSVEDCADGSGILHGPKVQVVEVEVDAHSLTSVQLTDAREAKLAKFLK